MRKLEVRSRKWKVGLLVFALLLLPFTALAQTHTMPGSNVVPSGASLTIQSGGAITAAAGSTVTGFGGGGGGNVSNTGTPTAGQKATWVDATHIQGVTDNALQWDGGATNLVAATARISLALVVGTNVQAWDADLDTWATKTPYAGNVTVTTGKTLNATNNLTFSGTDGSTLNVGTGGTLGTAAYTAATAYQAADTDLTTWAGLTPSANFQTMVPHTFAQMQTDLGLVIGTNVQAFDADLTTWAGVTPTANIQTWLATPSSANLRGAITDENGTGAALFSGATAPDFTTGFTIGAAAAAGKIPIGNGTNYVPSTPTWPTTAGTAGYGIRSDGTNIVSYPAQLVNSAITNQSPSTSDVYLVNSSVVVAAGDFKAKGQYRCIFDMVKSAGTGAIVISVRIGTAGTTSDTAQLTFTFGAGTSVADTGTFEIIANWRSVGTGSSAVVQGICRGQHNLATTGLFNNAAAWTIVGTPSGGFNSSTATTMGVSFNGSTAFAGTNSLTQAILEQP